MKILLDAMRFTYQRVNATILAGRLGVQDRARLIEARDQLADAAAAVLGPEDAQAFFEQPDGYRRIDKAHEAGGTAP